MRKSTVTISTEKAEVPVSIADPGDGATCAVIVIQEAFGVNDHIRDVTARLAAEGYLGMAPHLFHRFGDPVIPYDDVESAISHVRELTADGLLADLDACIELAAERGIRPSGTGVVGFCMGGTVSYFALTQRSLGAGVTFYGGGIAASRWEGVPSMIELVPSLRRPWLGLYGDADKGIPSAEVERLRRALPLSEAPTEIVRYPDAGHGFHCDARPAAYDELAAKDAWRRTLSWFAQHLA